jgi:hypothetical protein
MENSGSRLLPHRQAINRQISSWVGDHQRTPAVVCLFFFAHFLLIFILCISSLNTTSISYDRRIRLWYKTLLLNLLLLRLRSYVCRRKGLKLFICNIIMCNTAHCAAPGHGTEYWTSSLYCWPASTDTYKTDIQSVWTTPKWQVMDWSMPLLRPTKL